ncbi:hypothetical protein IHE44_0014108 [Lamprotornis superbus]|uniref:Cytosolic 5'-nucleotidase 1A n=1 Tax=Lamprotornis superbus TaxID=245042 RepID=A0A835TSS4_9PASS|nr:hypothetical protein IHE44_0014108 [Lamprotornis superbus]
MGNHDTGVIPLAPNPTTLVGVPLLTPPPQAPSLLSPDSSFLPVLQKDPSRALVIAVTTRAIFNLEEEHKLYLEKGKEEYTRHQQANQDKPLPPGTAFAFIQSPISTQAVQYVNKKILESNPAERDLFDILVLSNNSPESGVRIINSAKHYGLEISKFCFVSDEDSTQYLKSHGVKLFLSADRTDVCNALQRGGPLKAFAMHLGKMRKKFGQEKSPIRTYLVTARSGRDMGIRAIRTLREWGLPIDEAFFMDGAPKGPILAQIQPHIFFDDGLHNIQGAQNVGVPSAWVPSCC